MKRLPCEDRPQLCLEHKVIVMNVELYKVNRRQAAFGFWMTVVSVGVGFFESSRFSGYQLVIFYFSLVISTSFMYMTRVGVDQRGVFLAYCAFGRVLREVRRFPFDEVAMLMYGDNKTVVLLTTTGKISGRIFWGQGRLALGEDIPNRLKLLEDLVARIPKDKISPGVVALLGELKERRLEPVSVP